VSVDGFISYSNNMCLYTSIVYKDDFKAVLVTKNKIRLCNMKQTIGKKLCKGLKYKTDYT